MAASRRLAARAACGLALTLASCAPAGSPEGGRFTPTSTAGKTGTEPPGSGRTVPLKIVDLGLGSTLVYVPISFSGSEPVDLVLDTGASMTALDRGLAERLNLPAAAGIVGGLAGLAGVGAEDGVQTEVLRVERWQMGDVPLPATTVVTVNLSLPAAQGQPQGLLGSDVLRQFGAVTIDYAGRRLRLP